MTFLKVTPLKFIDGNFLPAFDKAEHVKGKVICKFQAEVEGSMILKTVDEIFAILL